MDDGVAGLLHCNAGTKPVVLPSFLLHRRLLGATLGQ